MYFVYVEVKESVLSMDMCIWVFFLKSRVSEIWVKRIRVKQGFGVFEIVLSVDHR